MSLGAVLDACVRRSGTASLRAPTYTAADHDYGPLHPDAMLSPRIASQRIGPGLVEAIPAVDIRSGADPEDSDGDGIYGRANIVGPAEFDMPMLGRSGLKAGNPTIREQTASAFAGETPETDAILIEYVLSGFEARRSGRSLQHIPLCLNATRDLARLLSGGYADLEAAFDRVIAKAEAPDDPVLAGVAKPERRFRVEILQLDIDRIRAAAATIGSRLGITAGFNALDGD